MSLSAEIRARILGFQRNEITEYHIYNRLAAYAEGENAQVLRRIGEDEKRHYELWRAQTDTDVAPDRMKILWFTLLGRLFGLTFAIKLMEGGEQGAQAEYGDLVDHVPDATRIAHEEQVHEHQLIEMIDEERLQYTGSIVLGISDALVELTGALAGFTLALRNTELVALTGLITGIAAAMSMGASEYLSTKNEGGGQSPLKAAIYTGSTYLLTVALLVTPYLVFSDLYVCLGATLGIAVLIVAVFNFYNAVVKSEPFRRHFGEMVGLTLGVATLSFGIGWAVRRFLGVEI